jgi:hypothetical protein
MADLLWHYTTGAGLRGILEKNLLWATDVRYMNDESELNYPVSLLDEAFDEALGRLPDEVTKTWISHQPRDHPHEMAKSHLFAARDKSGARNRIDAILIACDATSLERATQD